jgi:hypothetical protein
MGGNFLRGDAISLHNRAGGEEVLSSFRYSALEGGGFQQQHNISKFQVFLIKWKNVIKKIFMSLYTDYKDLTRTR